jgi:hypothetical protein
VARFNMVAHVPLMSIEAGFLTLASYSPISVNGSKFRITRKYLSPDATFCQKHWILTSGHFLKVISPPLKFYKKNSVIANYFPSKFVPNF